jgi:hypothetical protein
VAERLGFAPLGGLSPTPVFESDSPLRRVYPGQIYSETPPAVTNLNFPHSINLQLLAAHGYAVLLPSRPRKPPGSAIETYFELIQRTLPAVDKVIALGSYELYDGSKPLNLKT